MQSQQETVLEEFMQRSFGAQFLYAPKKYEKGTAQREPADLAWAADGLVILFYMTSSKVQIAAQIEHNRRQAIGYHRLWSTGRTRYALRGKNRFGDECFVPYSTVRSYLTFLVVSEHCGVDVIEPITRDIQNTVVVIPEALIHWVAEFGGTIVDLLILIDISLERKNEIAPPADRALDVLGALVAAYVKESFTKADPTGRYISGQPQLDYRFLGKYLSSMKIPASFGKAVSTAKGREDISRVFGDLMLVEYASLAAVAEKAILASEPPHFRKWAILKTRGLYYSFVVATVHMGSSNIEEVTNAALDASKNEAGEIDCISVFYGNFLDANEYRSPLMFGLPPTMPPKHAIVLAESIFRKWTSRPNQEGVHIAT